MFCFILSTLYPHFIHTLHTIINKNIGYTQNCMAKLKNTSQFQKKKKKRFSLRRAKLATLGIFIVKWISHDISDTVIFKKFVPFTDCIKEINDEQVDNEKDLDIVMPIWNFVEYSGNCSKTSTISRSESFKYKAKQQEELLMLVIQVH